MNETKVLRTYATDELYEWLTKEKNEARTLQYIEESAALAMGGKIRQTGASYIPEGDKATLSDNIRGVAAIRLARSFGEDASDETYDMKTWAGAAGYHLGLMVDYYVLADRLLRKFVVEYVGSEAHSVEPEEDEE
jgi:hypothetical protein